MLRVLSNIIQIILEDLMTARESAAAKPNQLHDLGYKIFLDRYAQKDMTRSTLAVGDIVIVVVDPQSGQREVGKIAALDAPKVTVELLNGESMTTDIERIDKPLETLPEQMMERVAAGIAEAEATPELRQQWSDRFRWLLDDWKFVPAGRILAAAGTGQDLTFYNCYVLPSPKDSRSGIINTLGQMTEIMSRGGGVGINVSSLRPHRAYVKGVNGRSSGAVSWGALYSFVTGLIEQGGCFGPDERIATDAGLIPAAELADRIDTGETFYAHTHKGLRKITARFRNGVKPLYEVTTSRGYKVRITDEHKVAVLMDGQITTMPLSFLVPGDEILLLLGGGVDTEHVMLKSVDYVPQTSGNKDVRLPKSLDEDLAYLVGYMHGDGYTHYQHDRKTVPNFFSMATADVYPQIRQRIVDTIKVVFDIDAIVKNGDGACKNVRIYSRLALEFLITNGLLKARAENIRVPEAIFRSPSSVQAAFIAGYFDADGCNRGRKGGYGIDSISREMLKGVQQLLALNGIVSRIHVQERQGNWQTIYRLNVTGREFKQRFADFVSAAKVSVENGKREENTYPVEVWKALGVRSKYRQRIHDGVSDRISYAQLGRISERLAADGHVEAVENIGHLRNVIPDEIESITPIGESEVYDFEVEDVHLLSGAGIYTSNSRRGALMLILNDWHPDVFEFINSKRVAGRITNANISVGISDKLMEAIKVDGDWDLVFPDSAYDDYDETWDGDLDKWVGMGRKVVHYQTVKARDVWNAVIESAWSSAEPGIWFRERANKMSNSYYFNPLVCTNPCGEQSLAAWSVCNLGAINLARFYDPNTDDVDWEMLGTAARYATRFLDNVIDATPYFFDENKDQQLRERRVGLNTMGIAELMIRLGIRYGSDESVAFIDKLYEFLAREIYLTSADLSAEKGAFPCFNAEKFLQSGFMESMPEDVREAVRTKGIRNVTLMTQAPTGTTGTMVNTSTGIEPFFSWVYYRKSRLGLHEEQVPLVQEWYEQHPGETQLPDQFVTAMELSPKDHVRVQAAIQRWIDSSISKTCNVPNDYTVDQVRELYEYMYELGCKGGTIYRDGSRDEQVLMLKDDERAKEPAKAEMSEKPEKVEKTDEVSSPHKVYPRPHSLTGVTVSRKTPFGTAYVTMNNDENQNPFEVFITVGKAGSDLQADAEGLGRMVSLQLRTTAPHNRREMLRLVVEQLRGIGGTRSVGFGPGRVTSLPDAVASVLEECYFKSEDAQQLRLPTINGHSSPPEVHQNGKSHSTAIPGADLCPSCGTISLVRAEGCKKCLTCDYSEC
jgi:adenosylcobalamin-dependent ribonucleoside-diphosphate reductase